MSTATSTTSGTVAPVRTHALPIPADAVPLSAELISLRERLADYLTLTKPRIAVMGLLTVALGFSLGSLGEVHLSLMGHSLLGIGLVAASSSILNQVIERRTDRYMRRTANRPLPSGRVSTIEALLLGLITGGIGIGWLWLVVNPLTAILSAATLLLYVAVYTPLKRYTSLCTAIGAIPGALPPVLGWTAAGGELNTQSLALFGILFLWQFPHFLAIAWLYREQYALAGMRMLPRHEGTGIIGRLAMTYAIVLIPVSLLPRMTGMAGNLYFGTALVLGISYLIASIRFRNSEQRSTAKQLIWTSLVYLPVLLGVLTWDHWRLLR